MGSISGDWLLTNGRGHTAQQEGVQAEELPSKAWRPRSRVGSLDSGAQLQLRPYWPCGLIYSFWVSFSFSVKWE